MSQTLFLIILGLILAYLYVIFIKICRCNFNLSGIKKGKCPPSGSHLSARPFQRLSVFTFLSISFFHSMPCRVGVVIAVMMALVVMRLTMAVLRMGTIDPEILR